MGVALIICLCGTTGVLARQSRTVNLTSYLQAEQNEVALLTAQANYLTQQGDPLGAGVLASYIPDHRTQAAQLAAQITAQGGNPVMVPSNAQPFLGTRDAILSHDLNEHQKALASYQNLQRDSTDPAIQQLAMMGLNGASRHFSSLQVAQAATSSSSRTVMTGLLAALTLEQAMTADLQMQAMRLTALGDTTTANTLMSLVPQHQTQAANIANLITQMGGNSSRTTVPQAVALATRDQIIAHESIVNTQLVNTYALPLAGVPTSPLRTIAMQGQSIALAGLQQFNRPSTVVSTR
jgi:hypothetical protein